MGEPFVRGSPNIFLSIVGFFLEKEQCHNG